MRKLLQSNIESHTGVCGFCDEIKILCKSHIIPEFEYKTLYDEKHRMSVIQDTVPGGRYIQKGFYEYLLCTGCERFLNSEYESFYSKNYSNLLPAKLKRIVSEFTIKGVDYSRFKLYLLSVFWRILIARNMPFSHVKNQMHINPIRQLLKSKIPPCESDYPLYGFLIIDKRDGEVFKEIITTPRLIRISGIPAVMAVFGGVKWVLFLSTGLKMPPPSIRQNGLLVLQVRDIKEIGEIRRAISYYKYVSS